mgnify:CR=1 FL=1
MPLKTQTGLALKRTKMGFGFKKDLIEVPLDGSRLTTIFRIGQKLIKTDQNWNPIEISLQNGNLTSLKRIHITRKHICNISTYFRTCFLNTLPSFRNGNTT